MNKKEKERENVKARNRDLATSSSRQDDVVTVVTVPMTAETAFWEPPAAHQAVLVVPIIEARLPGCYSRGGQACPRALCARWGP